MKTILKKPQFKPLRSALVTWLAFVVVVVGIGCYASLSLFGDVKAVNTCTSTGVETDWNTAGTWGNCEGTVPQTGDSVTITHAVTIGDYTINEIVDLTIGSGGTLTQSNDNTQIISGTLTVESGGVLTHSTNGSTQIYIIDFSAANFDIQTGGSVNVDGKGYHGHTSSAGYGPGAGESCCGSSGGGGSHAGNGGYGKYTDSSIAYGGDGYCDITNPSTIGSSGGWPAVYTRGGDGGGLIRLNASNNITINGTITADGTNGASWQSGGGGAGGGIKLSALGSILGTPQSFTAVGSVGISNAGGGGGGCALLEYAVDNSVSSTLDYFAIQGGASGISYSQDGGSGLALIKQSGTDGELYLEHTKSGVEVAETRFNTSTFNLDELYISGDSVLMVSSTETLVLASTTINMMSGGRLNLYGTLDTPSPVILVDGLDLGFYSGGVMEVADDFTVTNSNLYFYNGQNVPFNNLTVGSGSTMTMYNYTTSEPLVFSGDLTIASGATLKHADNSSAQTHIVNIQAENINIFGSANVNSLGYDNGGVNQDGYGPAGGYGIHGNTAGGGAHGGNGGAGTGGAGGTAYCDSEIDVATMGAGGGMGGHAASGGYGGGLLVLSATSTIDLEGGTITANASGGWWYANAGGAGGGIKLSATTVTGTPASFTANGGAGYGPSYPGGGGGGGCVRVEYVNACSIDSGDISVAGGASGGGAAVAGTSDTPTIIQLTPAAPTTLYSNETDASSSDVDPTDLTDLTPVFTYNCDTPDSNNCTKYQIQVDNDNDFSSTIWDSGSDGTNLVVADGAQSSNITYSGSQLNYNTTYYWRVRAWNVAGAGSWSDGTDTFYAPRTLELYNFNYGGAVQQGQVKNIEWGSINGESNETVKIEYSTNDFSSATTVSSTVVSTAANNSYSWTIPAISSANVKIRISSNNDSNNYAITSQLPFTIQAGSVATADSVKYGRTYSASSTLYSIDSGLTFSDSNVVNEGSAWYNSSWTKRKPITITNNTASELTNFQVSSTIAYDSDMQVDFDDLRFTSSDGTTLIDHWVETKTDSDSAVVWIEVPTIPASDSVIVYMYYDNDGASSVSDIGDTFLFGDDFETGSLDTDTKWNVDEGGPASVESYDGSYRLKIDEETALLTKTRNWSNYIYEGDMRINISSYPGLLYNSYQEDYYYDVYFSSGDIYRHYGGLWTRAYETAIIWTPTINTWYEFKITSLADQVSLDFYLKSTGASVESGSYNLNDSYTTGGVGFMQYDSSALTYYDNARVRKYASVEPTVSSGSEESFTLASLDINSVLTHAHAYSVVSAFTASSTVTGSGVVEFQFTSSTDGVWYYCSGSVPTVASAGYPTHTNTAAEITDECLVNLEAGSFSVKAFLYGGSNNSAILDYVSFIPINNTAPTLTSPTITNPQDGTGDIKIVTTVNDSDTDQVKILTEYKAGACGEYSGFVTTTLLNSVSSTYFSGDVTINNSEASGYNISTIKTTSGANELWYYWDSDTQLPLGNGTYCITMTPHDGTIAGTMVSSTVVLDNVAPDVPGDLTINTTSTQSVTLNFGSESADTNFSEYKIFYKQADSGVAITDTEHSDGDLSTINYGGTSNTSISNLATSTQYNINIWGYDSYGNYTPAAGEIAFYTLADAPGTPTVVASTTAVLHLTIGTDTNPSSVEYSICKKGLGDECDVGSSYIDSDGSVTSTAVWQTKAVWGDTGFDVTGLSENVGYRFLVKARNGDNIETVFSEANATVYTLSGAVTDFVITNSTVTSTYQITLTFTTTTQSGMKIERDNGCDNEYDDTIFDSSNSLDVSPTTTSSGLSANTCYRFKISSYNLDGTINNTNTAVSSDSTTPPGQVAGLNAQNVDETAISWAWTQTADADGYKIYDSVTEALIATIANGATVSYNYIDLIANTLYSVIVRAYEDTNGTGIASSVVSTYTNASSVVGYATDSITTSTITWSWTDSGQTGFWVENISEEWNTNTTSTKTGLTANTSSTIRVKAKNEDGDAVSYTTSNVAYTAQEAPTGVSFMLVTATGMTILTDNAFANPDANNSRVVFTDTSFGGTSISTVANPSWSRSGLTPNTEYSYTAHAENGDGTATVTAAASQYTRAAKPGQITTAVGADATSLVLTLAANSNPAATNFQLFCTTTDEYVDTELKTLTGDSTDWDTLTNWDVVTVTGLTPNTAYQFEAIAKNANSLLSSTSTASTAVYTNAAVPTSFSSTADSPTQVTISWNANSNPAETEYYAEDVNDPDNRNSGWIITTSTSFAGLTPGVEYTFRIKARNHNGEDEEDETDWLTGGTSQTDPGTPGQISIATSTPTTLILTVDEGSNTPASIYALLYSSSTGQYVDTVAKTLTGDRNDWDTFTNWTDTVTVTGLTPNTAYTFQAIAKNGVGTLSATSTISDTVYTLANAPTGGTATAPSSNGSTQLTVSWGANSNPATTQFYVQDTTGALTSGWITTNSHTFTGLTAATSYTFKVKARNADNIETAWLTNITGTTANPSGGAAPPPAPPAIVQPTVGHANGGGSSPTVDDPDVEVIKMVQVNVTSQDTPQTVEQKAVPVVAKSTTANASVISGSFSAGSGISMQVGSNGAAHSIICTNVGSRAQGLSSVNFANFAIHSDRQEVELNEGEEKLIDIDNDGIADIHIKADSIDSNSKKVQTTITDLDDIVFTINSNLTVAEKNKVTVRIKEIPKVYQVAISEDPTFANTAFVPYAKFLNYTIKDNTPGLKTLYLRLRTYQGGQADVEDTIFLSLAGERPREDEEESTNNEELTDCSLEHFKPYKVAGISSVYYITNECKKRAFKNPTSYFTYFTSWDEVITTNKDILTSIPDDTLGFMPKGSLYDAKSGSLLKTVTNPKVYLILDTTKNWVTTDLVFNALKLSWSWLEDVTQSLLDRFEEGTPLESTTTYPNYTLIKYPNNPKVYRLESDPNNEDNQIKRHIIDPETFNALGYRWDRIIEVGLERSWGEGEIISGEE